MPAAADPPHLDPAPESSIPKNNPGIPDRDPMVQMPPQTMEEIFRMLENACISNSTRIAQDVNCSLDNVVKKHERKIDILELGNAAVKNKIEHMDVMDFQISKTLVHVTE